MLVRSLGRGICAVLTSLVFQVESAKGIIWAPSVNAPLPPFKVVGILLHFARCSSVRLLQVNDHRSTQPCALPLSRMSKSRAKFLRRACENASAAIRLADSSRETADGTSVVVGVVACVGSSVVVCARRGRLAGVTSSMGFLFPLADDDVGERTVVGAGAVCAASRVLALEAVGEEAIDDSVCAAKRVLGLEAVGVEIVGEAASCAGEVIVGVVDGESTVEPRTVAGRLPENDGNPVLPTSSKLAKW